MNQAELAELTRLQVALAAAQAGQPPAQAQPAPLVQQNFVAQVAPVGAVHTVQMPLPIDTQGAKFVLSLPTWAIWTLSILAVILFVFSLIMTSVLSSRASPTVAAAAAPATALYAPQTVTFNVPTIKSDPIKIDVNVTGVQPGKP